MTSQQLSSLTQEQRVGCIVTTLQRTPDIRAFEILEHNHAEHRQVI